MDHPPIGSYVLTLGAIGIRLGKSVEFLLLIANYDYLAGTGVVILVDDVFCDFLC